MKSIFYSSHHQIYTIFWSGRNWFSYMGKWMNLWLKEVLFYAIRWEILSKNNHRDWNKPKECRQLKKTTLIDNNIMLWLQACVRKRWNLKLSQNSIYSCLQNHRTNNRLNLTHFNAFFDVESKYGSENFRKIRKSKIRLKKLTNFVLWSALDTTWSMLMVILASTREKAKIS